MERKELWAKYKVDVNKFKRKKAKNVAEEQQLLNKKNINKFDKIKELLWELDAMSQDPREQAQIEKTW